MSAAQHGLRLEASLLASRIAEVETHARHCRGLAAITPQPEVAVRATDEAIKAERAALRMASKLSLIVQRF